MITDLEKLQGARIVAPDGAEVGTVDAIYVDTESGRPEWAGLRTASVEGRMCLVPLSEAEQVDGVLQIPYAVSQVTSAPPCEVGRHLSAEDEESLFAHYGLAYDARGAPMGSPVARPVTGAEAGPGEGDPGARLRMYWP